MKKPKIAILGASGIGRFHAREFYNAGCDVIAILGSTKESSQTTSEILERDFKIKVRPYHKLETLLNSETLDAVSICTPPKLHAEQIKRCLESNLHVLSEKPFVRENESSNYQTAKDLVSLAKDRGKILTVNTQWPSVLEKLPKDETTKKVERFSMYMEPSGFQGLALLTECVPHFNSMLTKLIPDGKASAIKFPTKIQDEIKIEFDYTSNNSTSKVEYSVKNKKEKPTNVGFSINGKKFKRKIGENYRQQLSHRDELIDIEDPLKISITKFVKSFTDGKPLITTEELLQNVKLQDLIVQSYLQST